MSPEQWQRVTTLYSEALALPSSERRSFVEKIEEDPVRRELNRLLEFDPDTPARVDRPVVSPDWLLDLVPTGLKPGAILLDRFRIVRLAGRGGMGEVYEAEDLRLGEKLAIKTIRPEIASDPRMLERFRREIALSRQVTHPNVCRVFDLHETPGPQPLVFLTMEYLEGETLAAFLAREAPLQRRQARPLIQQMIDGLTAAHAAGIIHRDFKPANVFLARDRADGTRLVITDFGLARTTVRDEGQATTTHAGAGTPVYMAPEQLEGRAATEASDLYALGVVMFEMATGVRPYASDSPLQAAVRKVKEPPPAPSAVHSAVDPTWEAIILRCLDPDPARRFPVVRDVLDSLDRDALPALPVARSSRRWPVLAAAAALLALVAGLWIAPRWRRSPEPPAAASTWYREGVAALQEGSLAVALRAFEKTVEAAPQWAEGYARLAQTYDEMDQPDRARKALLGALQRRPGGFWHDTTLIDAVQALVARDLPRAVDLFQNAGARDDQLIDLARVLNRADRPREALAVLDRILKVNRDQPAAQLNRAILGMRSDMKAAEVRDALTRARKAYETLGRQDALAETSLQESLWLYRQQDLPAAIRLGREALDHARQARSAWTEVRCLFHLARTLRENGRPEDEYQPLADAGLQLARTGKLWAPLLQGKIDLGIRAFTQGLTEEALQQFTEVRQSAQEYEAPQAGARAAYWQGRAWMELRDLVKARAAYEQAIAFWKSNGFERERLRSAIFLTAVTQREGRMDEARQTLEDALTAVKQFGDFDLIGTAHFRLAALASNRGDFPASLALWRSLETEAQRSGFDEDFFRARRAQAVALLNLGRFEEAEAVSRALRADPRFRPLDLSLELDLLDGMLLLERNQPVPALGIFARIQREAEAQHLSRWSRRIRSYLCTGEILAGQTRRAREVCGADFAESANKQAAATSGYLLADLLLAEGRYGEARDAAESAREAHARLGHQDNVLYSLLIRGQAERRAGEGERLAATVREAEQTFGKIRQAWGDAPARTYLKRPLYQARWDEIHRGVHQ